MKEIMLYIQAIVCYLKSLVKHKIKSEKHTYPYDSIKEDTTPHPRQIYINTNPEHADQ